MYSNAFEAMAKLIPGLANWDYAAGEQVYERRLFVWLPRLLPVVDRKSRWDGKTTAFLWLRFATLRGTRFGWETCLKD